MFNRQAGLWRGKGGRDVQTQRGFWEEESQKSQLDADESNTQNEIEVKATW